MNHATQAQDMAALAARPGTGVCPVCNGSTRRPVPQALHQYLPNIAGYDRASDTLACDNCGGQTMYGRATGQVPLRPDGTPCKHEYQGQQRGNCYVVYRCTHGCGFTYDIDSSD